jgi:hypothetical protein
VDGAPGFAAGTAKSSACELDSDMLIPTNTLLDLIDTTNEGGLL